MMKRSVLMLPVVLALAACYDTAPPPYTAPPPAPMATQRADYIQYGTITQVRPVTMQRSTDGDRVVGAVAGGLVGAVIGNQFGAGSGKDLMTGAGAVTGAIVGSNLAAQGGTYTSYAWTVRLDNGGTMTVIQATNTFQVGQRVSVVHSGGNVYLR